MRQLVVVVAVAVAVMALGSGPGPAGAATLVSGASEHAGSAHDLTSSSTAGASLSFLPPMGRAALDGANAKWLLRFLSVEVCRMSGPECAAVVARFAADRAGAQRLRLEADATGSYFVAVWSSRDTRLIDRERYRLRVRVGPMEIGGRDLVVSSKGARVDTDPFPIKAGASLPVKFRVDESAFADGLAGLTVTPGSSRAGGIVHVAAAPLALPAGGLQLLVDGQSATVRAGSAGTLVAGVPLFLDASEWPAPPAGPVDVLLFRDGVAVAVGRNALTVGPWRDAPGSARRAQQALDDIAATFGRIGAALADESGEQQQWLTGLTGALDRLVNGSDPRSLAGALARTSDAERRLLDGWFAESGVLAALREYEKRLSDAASAFERAGTTAGIAGVRALALDLPTTTLAAPALASTSFPTDVELSDAMRFYETAKAFGETFVGQTNTQFSQYVGIAAGLIGLVRAVPAVAIVSAVLAVADFAINKLFIALLPANIDRFELTLAEVLLDPGEITDSVLRIEAVNEPPPIGIQEVIGTLLNVLGVRDVPEIQSLTDALLQTASYMLGLVQNAISTYANEHPELQLNTSIGSVPAMRWHATITNPGLVDRNSDTDAVIRGLPDRVEWQAQTGPDAGGYGLIYATTVANAFGDDLRNSNKVVVTTQASVVVTVSPASVSLLPGASQQFASSVSGSANTSVTWSATGGSITQTGLYTAGSATGTFTVTATSVADPGIRADATVVVGPQRGVLRVSNRAAVAAGCFGGPSSPVVVSPANATVWDDLIACSGDGGAASQGSSSFEERYSGAKLVGLTATGFAHAAAGSEVNGGATAAGRYELTFDVVEPTRVMIAGTLSPCDPEREGYSRLLLVSFDTGVVVRRTCESADFTAVLAPGRHTFEIESVAGSSQAQGAPFVALDFDVAVAFAQP